MKYSFIILVLMATVTFTCQPTHSDLPKNIDHLVYTAPDLQSGMDSIESLLGVRPVIGGRHPDYGTHNALLSLGTMTYLEIIAPDTTLAEPPEGRLFADGYAQPPRLFTWVLRTGNIENLRDEAVDNGIPLGTVASGQRQKPDGTILSWQLSDPYALPFDGAVPFLINWGETPHPAGSIPSGGKLIGLIIEHPEPEQIRESLNTLNVDIKVVQSDQFRLIAEIETKEGIVTLE